MTHKDFVSYFNSFYGKKGIYPIRDVAAKELAVFIPDNEPFYGDSLDRENIRDQIFTKEELDKAYSQ